MTLKSYLRMLLAAVTLMFVTTGCNDDEEKVGPPPSYTFGIAVSDVTETEATVTVTPSNDQATYYCGAVKKADFDAFESDAAYAQNILATLKAAADRKVLSLEEYLQTALSKGSSPKKIADLTAGTDYYAVVIGILTDGRLTSDLVKEAFKTVDIPEPDMVFSITMTPGYNGEDTHSAMSVNFKVSERPAVSGKYLLGPTSYIEEQIAEGKSYDDILDTGDNVYEFTADELTELNSEQGTVGENWVWGNLSPETSYTVVARVKDADGNSLLKTAEKSTAASQGGSDLTFTVSVTNIGAKGADINITPSNSDTYFFDVYPASVVDEIPDDNQLIAAIIGANGGDVTRFLSSGPDGYSREVLENNAPLDPATEYCVVAFGCNGTAGTTAATRYKFTTLAEGGGGEGPALEVGIVAGYQGQDTQTKITASFRVTGEPAAVSGKYLMVPKSSVDEIVAQGASYDDIMDNERNGAAFTAEDLTKLNSTGGVGWYWENRTPGTEYIAMAKVKDAAGNSTLKYAVASTDPAGEASDAYKAWLGTWTVTSTSSEISKAPLEFDVTFNQKVANSSYVAVGWTTAMWRDDPSKYNSYFATAKFDAETGGCYFDNAQVISNLDDEDGTGEYLFNIRYASTDGKTYVNNSNQIIGMVGTLESNKSSAQMVGSQLQNQNGENVGVVTSMSHYYWYYTGASAGKIYGTTPGTAFKVGNSIDYPIGPYTMVKKSSASSITPSVASIPSLEQMHDARVMHESNLSSVLSVRAVTTTPSKQRVMLEGKEAVINQLDFVRPAAAYKAKISNVANIEKPLGLKKHFIKK